jgi:hypothetical protein
MPDATKRTLAELVTLHELEPDLTEVVTEGRSDASLILWFLRRRGIDAAVYCVSDRLDVPSSEVRRRGQNIGNKGRVIAAAFFVHETSDAASQKVTFVYDVDDDVLDKKQLPVVSCLLRTDYSSMEMYAYADDVIDKLLKLVLRAGDDLKSDAVLAAITAPLVSIAFGRLILKRINPPVQMVSAIERRCNLKGDVMAIDISALISDSINAAGGERALGISMVSLLGEHERELQGCVIDVRLVIRGHDFTRICGYYLKSVYPSLFREDRAPYKNPAIFEAVLMTCLEVGDLTPELLFQALLRRHGRAEKVA